MPHPSTAEMSSDNNLYVTIDGKERKLTLKVSVELQNPALPMLVTTFTENGKPLRIEDFVLFEKALKAELKKSELFPFVQKMLRYACQELRDYRLMR